MTKTNKKKKNLSKSKTSGSVKTKKRKKRRTTKSIKPRSKKRPVSRKREPARPVARYYLNNEFEFFYELKDLILKSSPAEKKKMVKRILKLGRVKLAIASGIFINKESSNPALADLLIVGDDIDKGRLNSFLQSLEAEVGKEIRFAIMEKDEFRYRLSMFDRFLGIMLESPHEKLINKLDL